ncbi:MAG: threonine/serine dehydratase [Alphaproteobacteria bacterium]|nr:threonine/serine dehydratase [Alphaproteobacteria bacterium]
MIDRAAIAAAEKLIRPHIRKTPVLAAEAADFGLDSGTLWFKLEQTQHTGSFKARGAFTNLLLRKVPAAGVAAASGGNHGAAVAFAARKLGHKARIFVPEISPRAKVERIRGYGAELVVGGARYPEALAACEGYIAQSGALSIHAFDQPETLIGQGTVGLEVEEQVPDLDTLLVAVGGGGLIGGIAAWFGGKVKVVGVEPEGAPTLHAAMAAGRPVDSTADTIAADSLAPKQVGRLMFPIAQRAVATVALVPDAAILEGQAMLWDRLRIVAEPGGAAVLAALLARRYVPAKGERVGLLICGANTTAVDFGRS